MSDWPIIERPLCDHLSARTNFRWSVEGGRTITSPLGVVQVVGGSSSLDVDANPNTARDFQVVSIPTMILFKDGAPVKRIVGAKGKAALLRELADAL